MCQECKINRCHDGIVLIDDIIAKAINADELALAAEREGVLREYIDTQWNKLSVKAARDFSKSIKSGSGNVSDGEFEKALRIVDNVMSKWSDIIKDRYTKDMEDIYKFAHIAAIKRATGYGKKPTVFNTEPFLPGIKKAERKSPPGPVPKITVSFDLIDESALESFKKHQIYWIGQHYKDNVSKHVANTAKEELIRLGRGRVEAGRVMESVVKTTLSEVRIPKGFNGSSKQYFEGLVANSATTQRVSSQLNVFDRAGFTKYEIVNPDDHRTCEKCQHLDGKQFFVSDGKSIISSVLNAKNPSQIKEIHPFITPRKAIELTNGHIGPAGTNKTRRLASGGYVMPPFHFRCRCNIDIVDDEPFAPSEFATGLPKNTQ